MTDYTPFQDVQAFHKLMDGHLETVPRIMDPATTAFRAGFKVEELVEWLYATAPDKASFEAMTAQLHAAIDQAVEKVSKKERESDILVGQVDALIDLLYFTYGSFVLMGVDPKPIFDIVHQANMGKIFPYGKAHFDPITHKILKPNNWEEDFAPEGRIKTELERQKKNDSSV